MAGELNRGPGDLPSRPPDPPPPPKEPEISAQANPRSRPGEGKGLEPRGLEPTPEFRAALEQAKARIDERKGGAEATGGHDTEQPNRRPEAALTPHARQDNPPDRRSEGIAFGKQVAAHEASTSGIRPETGVLKENGRPARADGFLWRNDERSAATVQEYKDRDFTALSERGTLHRHVVGDARQLDNYKHGFVRSDPDDHRSERVHLRDADVHGTMVYNSVPRDALVEFEDRDYGALPEAREYVEVYHAQRGNQVIWHGEEGQEAQELAHLPIEEREWVAIKTSEQALQERDQWPEAALNPRARAEALQDQAAARDDKRTHNIA
jgi:hypothetical protein